MIVTIIFFILTVIERDDSALSMGYLGCMTAALTLFVFVFTFGPLPMRNASDDDDDGELKSDDPNVPDVDTGSDDHKTISPADC